MKKLALIPLILAACAQPKNPAPPTPTATTAFLFVSNYSGAAELQAIDVKSREAGQVLASEAVSGDSFVRVFGETLYVIGRDYLGQNNTVTVIEPKKNYARACPDCQWPLGDKVNVQDFWAVSKTKAYMTTLPTEGSAAYDHRNDVWIMNPTTGAIGGYIDLAKALSELGDDLATKDTDGRHELGAIYGDDAHLFVVIAALDKNTFGLVAGDRCGYEPGRVVVIDLNTDKVTKVIKLDGSNPGKFVPELGTDNLLIATPGSLGNASIDDCGGIERIDQLKLVRSGTAYTEAQLGGSVTSFDLDPKQNGAAFLFTAGDFNNPTYEVRRIEKGKGTVGEPLAAPGPGGFFFGSFVEVNDLGEAYVGLPYGDGAKIGMWDVATGAELAPPLEPSLGPVDVAFFPGPAYSR